MWGIPCMQVILSLWNRHEKIDFQIFDPSSNTRLPFATLWMCPCALILISTAVDGVIYVQQTDRRTVDHRFNSNTSKHVFLIIRWFCRGGSEIKHKRQKALFMLWHHGIRSPSNTPGCDDQISCHFCNGHNFVCFSSRSVIVNWTTCYCNFSLMMGISYRCAPVCGNVDCKNNHGWGFPRISP